MRTIVLLALLVLLASCGGSPQRIAVESPQFQASYLPTLTLQRGRDACVESVLAVLSSRGYQVKDADPASGEIETDRRKFTVNATITTTNEGGDSVAMGQMEQSDKLWIAVAGDDKSCTVSYPKVRLWNGEEEMVNVQPAGGDWFLNNVIKPLNRDISEAD